MGLGLRSVAIVLLLVSVAAASLVLPHGAGSKAGTAARVEPRSHVVVDALGRRVEVPLNVSRVVAVGPGALRVVAYLNASSLVAGVEAVEKNWDPVGRPYIMAHPELRSLPVVSPGGPGKSPDPEAILAVHPDVVLATFLSREEADKLQSQIGVPVVVLGAPVLNNVDDFSRFFESLRIAGKILGREERAEQLIDFVKSIIWDLGNRTKGVEPSSSVYVGGIGFRGKHGITSSWCRYPVFELLGVRSVVDLAGCRGEHVDVDRELLIKWDPDIIFLDENGLLLILQDYKRDPGFYKQLQAFKLGNVYGILPYNYYATNYELALADAYYVGKILFPERFSDVDPKAKADEIIKFFVGAHLYDELARKYGGFEKLNLDELLEK